MLYLYLAIGGVLGTVARYVIGTRVDSWAGSAFPWGTFAVHLLGSFLLGLILRSSDLSSFSPELRGMLTVGFCGAFTTFSTFSFEALTLMQEGKWTLAATYAFGSLGLSLAAMALGLSIANLLFMPLEG